MQSRRSVTGTYITDLNENMSRTSRGPVVPSLRTDGKIVPLRGAGKVLTPRDLLITQGEALADGLGAPNYPCLFSEAGESGEVLSTHMKSLARLAMHMVSMGPFIDSMF